MNDFNKLASLLEEMGVPFKKEIDTDHWNIFHGWDYDEYDVPFGTKCSDTIRGYPGFYTKYAFDTNGNFLYVGAWE